MQTGAMMSTSAKQYCGETCLCRKLGIDPTRGHACAVERYHRMTRQGENGCVEWLGARVGKKHANGSGQYGGLKIAGSPSRAHRVFYQLFVGDIPEGLQVLHSCHNSTCVNPEHLHLGTNRGNMHEKALAGRAPCKLSVDEVRDIRARFRSGELQRVLAEEYGIHQADVSNIVNRKYWRHV